MPPEPPPDTATLTVPSDLLQDLRRFCDRNGLRLADVIEDALENAIHREHLEALMHEEGRLQERVQYIRKEALEAGFNHGFLAGALAFAGHPAMSARLRPAELDEPVDARPVRGEQLCLFD